MILYFPILLVNKIDVLGVVLCLLITLSRVRVPLHFRALNGRRRASGIVIFQRCMQAAGAAAGCVRIRSSVYDNLRTADREP